MATAISFEASEINMKGKIEHEFSIKTLHKIGFLRFGPRCDVTTGVKLSQKFNFGTIVIRETRSLRKSKKIYR